MYQIQTLINKRTAKQRTQRVRVEETVREEAWGVAVVRAAGMAVAVVRAVVAVAREAVAKGSL